MNASIGVKSLEWTDELVGTFWKYYAEHRQDEYFTSLFGDRIVSLTERFIPPGGAVCDYGCGSGNLIARLLKKHRTAGYDFTPANIHAAAQRLDGHPNLLGLHVLGAAESDARRYQAVYVVETVEHVLESHLDSFMANLNHLLDDDGNLIVATPHGEDLQANTVFCPACVHTFHRWQHVRSFNAESLTHFMARGGFVPVKVFTTDFSASTRLAKVKASLRPMLGRKNPHLVYVGRKAERRHQSSPGR